MPSALPEPKRNDAVKNWLVFPIGRLIGWAILGLCGRARIRGAYRVPKKGGILILSNHLADVDPFLVHIACPRNIQFMGKSELFEIPLLGKMMRWGNAFPVKRGEPDRAALKHAAELLKLGEAVCVFPEGQLSEDGELQPVKPGIALIVRLSGAPVICVGIRNTQYVMPYGSLIPRPTSKRVEAVWGEPRIFERHASSEEIVAWAEGQLRELSSEM